MRYWTLRLPVLADAIVALQIEQPVTVHVEVLQVPDTAEWAERDGLEPIGCYGYDEPPHHIYIDPYVYASSVEKAILHELRHAQQRERGHRVPLVWDMDSRDAYNDHPLELEAEETTRTLYTGEMVRRTVAPIMGAWTVYPPSEPSAAPSPTDSRSLRPPTERSRA